ncbi:hypothetical protein QOZ80_4AG0308900 [Eleusine coracana subsp. coracana]|nr:hypothetical protein QOZ80_4AG0308900 [Eleusine coracana subsp. coracana]
MDRPDHQHQFFMPLPMQQQHPQPHQLLMDAEQSSFLLGRGPGGGAGAGAAAVGRSGERKRRFTEEQIRSLESMFHAHHAKLEPREKAELARELGLQPRQVAIWFQNKRARWRSKQLEHDYAALKNKYDALHARVESLKHEKLALAAQLHELSERLREREDRGGRISGAGAAATASSSSCNGGGEEELEDDKRNVLVDMEPPESCVLGGPCTTPADVSVDSECDDHAVGYHDGFPDSFCAATPELWEPWLLLEWNAVA